MGDYTFIVKAKLQTQLWIILPPIHLQFLNPGTSTIAVFIYLIFIIVIVTTLIRLIKIIITNRRRKD
jgi:hypothetical protein